MKSLKLLILGMLVAMMGFATPVMGQCIPKISIGPVAYSVADDSQVYTAHVGDLLYYKVTVGLDGGDCDIINGEPNLVLPDGITDIDLDDGLALTSGSTMLYDLVGQVAYYYTVDLADAVGGYVTANAYISADSIYDPPNTTPSSATGTYPVRVIDPCTTVGIGADETTVLPGDPVVLTITELNNGNDPLDSPYVELLANGSPHSASPLNKASTEYQGGDTNGNDILDPGEQWEWQVTDNPTVDTTYTVIGHGIDSLGFDVTWCEDSPANTVCDENEKDEVSVTVECPEPCVEITKTVDCEISKLGDEVTYTICIENCGDSNLIDVEVTDDLLGGPLAGFPSVLEPGDPCCIDFPYTIQESDEPGPVLNVAHVTATDECDGETPVSDDSDEVEVVLVHPDFIATKDCRTEPLQVDDVAIFDVYFENIGDVCLRFDVCDIDPCSFDLAPGETMSWETQITVESEEDVENTITGTAILLPGDPLTTCGDPCACLDNVLEVEASDECDVSGGATRTPGFWKTHYYLTEYVLETHCIDVNLGWVDVNDVDVMMAIFWEKKAHQSKLCQARIQGSFHAMAAMLNNCHPDGLSLAGYMADNCSEYSPDDIPVILAGCDIDAIKDLTSCLGSYNEAGDDVEITFPAGLEAYNAQPGYAREQAEGLFPQTACDYDCDSVQAVGAKGQGKGKNK